MDGRAGGKVEGPFPCCMYSSIGILGILEVFGLIRIVLTYGLIAPATSVRLCRGILVAIPTAMPSLPFNSRFGNLWEVRLAPSRNRRSWLESRLFSFQCPPACVSNFINLLSVYLIAAGGSPSMNRSSPDHRRGIPQGEILSHSDHCVID